MIKDLIIRCQDRAQRRGINTLDPYFYINFFL